MTILFMLTVTVEIYWCKKNKRRKKVRLQHLNSIIAIPKIMFFTFIPNPIIQFVSYSSKVNS